MALPAPHSAPGLTDTVDELSAAVRRLEAALPPGTDTSILADFLEDDLREGLSAVAEVQAHFDEILEVLGTERLSAIRLLNASDDFRVLARLEYLVVVVSQLRRRLSQAAGSLHRTR